MERAVAICNECKEFREQYWKSHSHSKNTRIDTTVIRYLITNDGTFGSIHDKPDISFHTTYFNVSFISSEYLTSVIVVIINEWFDTDSGRIAVFSNTLVRDINVVKVYQSLFGFLERQTKVHM